MVNYYDVTNLVGKNESWPALLSEDVAQRFGSEQADESMAKYKGMFFVLVVSSISVGVSAGAITLTQTHSKTIALLTIAVVVIVGLIISGLLLKQAHGKLTHPDTNNIDISNNLPALLGFYNEFAEHLNKDKGGTQTALLESDQLTIDIQEPKSGLFKKIVKLKGQVVIDDKLTNLNIYLGMPEMYPELKVTEYSLEVVDAAV